MRPPPTSRSRRRASTRAVKLSSATPRDRHDCRSTAPNALALPAPAHVTSVIVTTVRLARRTVSVTSSTLGVGLSSARQGGTRRARRWRRATHPAALARSRSSTRREADDDEEALATSRQNRPMSTWWNPPSSVERQQRRRQAVHALKDNDASTLGSLVPHRIAPNRTLIHRGEGAVELDEEFILVEGAVVLQLGPFRGLFLRAGCAPRVSWRCSGRRSSCASRSSRTCASASATAQEAGRARRRDLRRREAHRRLLRLDVARTKNRAKRFLFAGTHKGKLDALLAKLDRVAGDLTLAVTADGQAAKANPPPPRLQELLVWERGAWTTSGGRRRRRAGRRAAAPRGALASIDVRSTLEWGEAAADTSRAARDGVMNDNFSAFVVKLDVAALQARQQGDHRAHFFRGGRSSRRGSGATPGSISRRAGGAAGRRQGRRALVHAGAVLARRRDAQGARARPRQGRRRQEMTQGRGRRRRHSSCSEGLPPSSTSRRGTMPWATTVAVWLSTIFADRSFI